MFEFKHFGRFGIFYFFVICQMLGVIQRKFPKQQALQIQCLQFILHYLLFSHGYINTIGLSKNVFILNSTTL